MEQALSIPRQTLTCRNCGHATVENFCARCGQENTHHVLPLAELLRDVLDEFVKFDSRLLVTLKPLFTRPGFLTNEFLAGRRAGYIAPLRLYFMVSTVYFLAFSYHAASQMQHIFETSSSLSVSASAPRVLEGRTVSTKEKTFSAASAADTTQKQAKLERRERMLKRLQSRMVEGFKWYVDHMPTITIFLIPAYAFILQILYWRSQRLYMEHLVCMLHLQAFAFLAALPALLLADDLTTWNVWLNIAVNSIYPFFAMRRVYGQGLWKTGIKVGLLLLGQFFMAGIAGGFVMLYFVLR